MVLTGEEVTMMVLNNQPKLADLHAVIAKVKKYPVTAGEVISLAKQSGASSAVIDFYNSFPDDAIFSNQEDLAARSEQVEILNSEPDQPEEIYRSAEED